MPLASILFGLALAAAVLPFVIKPFLGARRAGRLTPAPRVDPDLQRQAALAALRDLDFDYRVGKVADEDYAPARQRLLVEAAEGLQAQAAAPDWEDDVEAAVRARRAQAAPGGRVCSACHAPLRPGDRFCGHCGAADTCQVYG